MADPRMYPNVCFMWTASDQKQQRTDEYRVFLKNESAHFHERQSGDDLPWRDAGLHHTWRASWHFPETGRLPGLESFPWKSRWRYETGVIRTHQHWAGHSRLALIILWSSRGLEFDEERFTHIQLFQCRNWNHKITSEPHMCLAEWIKQTALYSLHLMTPELHVEEYSCSRARFEAHMHNWIRAAKQDHDATSEVTINLLPVIISHLKCTAYKVFKDLHRLILSLQNTQKKYWCKN